MGIDDALDLLAEHAVGGMIGLIFNGLFARNSVIALDGVNTSIQGGWLDHNWKQLYIQFAYVCAVTGYAFVMTALIAKAIDIIPGLGLRAPGEAEHIGMDDFQVSITFHNLICLNDPKPHLGRSENLLVITSKSDETTMIGHHHLQSVKAPTETMRRVLKQQRMVDI